MSTIAQSTALPGASIIDGAWQLGMTWSPLGILLAPSKLIVRGRLVRR